MICRKIQTVGKNGGSKIVNIPQYLAFKYKLDKGALVSFSEKDGGILIKPKCSGKT